MEKENKKIIIVGAGAAGRLAAITAKKTNPQNEVYLFTQEKDIFIRCSAPYAISGENELAKLIKPWDSLIKIGINLIKEEVKEIKPEEKIVITSENQYPYDSLILATGASPFLPNIRGVEKRNVFTLRTSSDTERIINSLIEGVNSVVVVGGGAIGVETAAAFAKRGLQVSIVEMFPFLLNFLDEEFSLRIKEKLAEKGIRVLLNTRVEEILGKEKVEGVKTSNEVIESDLVLFACGVRPNLDLAKKIGLEVGRFGIKTNEYLETSIKDIYAAGDCRQDIFQITGEEVSVCLAPRAVLDGKIAGKNASGLRVKAPLSLAPFSLEVFGLQVGAVGINEKKAKEKNLPICLGRAKSLTRHDSMKEAKEIEVKLIFNKENKKIIGGEIIGGEGVSQRLNLLSLAIQKECLLDDLLILQYTSSPAMTPLPFAEPIVLAAESAKEEIDFNF